MERGRPETSPGADARPPLDQALDRAEAALARIEAAAFAGGTGENDLSIRHAELKQSVAQAITRIDDLIGGQGE